MIKFDLKLHLLIMDTATQQVEFTLPSSITTDKTHPVKWILSHAWKYWYLLIGGVVGSILNATLAGLTPVYTGQAFNLVQTEPQNSKNGYYASLRHCSPANCAISS